MTPAKLSSAFHSCLPPPLYLSISLPSSAPTVSLCCEGDAGPVDGGGNALERRRLQLQVVLVHTIVGAPRILLSDLVAAALDKELQCGSDQHDHHANETYTSLRERSNAIGSMRSIDSDEKHEKFTHDSINTEATPVVNRSPQPRSCSPRKSIYTNWETRYQHKSCTPFSSQTHQRCRTFLQSLRHKRHHLHTGKMKKDHRNSYRETINAKDIIMMSIQQQNLISVSSQSHLSHQGVKQTDLSEQI